MSVERNYEMCCRYRGRAVEIKTRDGHVHRGIIENVDQRRVYIRPLGNQGLGGFGYGFYGFGGLGVGAAYGLALGSIATLALLPFFFW